MSKFMRASPRLDPRVARSLTRPLSGRRRLLLLLGRLGGRRRELLDQLPDLRGGRGARVELQVGLVRGEGRRGVAGGLRRLRELELRVRTVRLELGELLVRADRTAVRLVRLLVEVVRRGVRRARLRLLDRVGAERRAELAGGSEARARRSQLLSPVRRLVSRDVVLRLRELEAAELAPHLRVLGPQVGVLLERRDRVRRVALRLVGGREIAEGLGIRRMLLHFLQRLRDGVAASAEDVEAAEELVEPAVRAGADAEERERHSEEDGEHEIRGLRAPAHAREEELLVRVAAGSVALPPAGLRLPSLLLDVLGLLRPDCSTCHRWLRVATENRKCRRRTAAWHRADRGSPRARSTPRRAPRAAGSRSPW